MLLSPTIQLKRLKRGQPFRATIFRLGFVLPPATDAHPARLSLPPNPTRPSQILLASCILLRIPYPARSTTPKSSLPPPPPPCAGEQSPPRISSSATPVSCKSSARPLPFPANPPLPNPPRRPCSEPRQACWVRRPGIAAVRRRAEPPSQILLGRSRILLGSACVLPVAGRTYQPLVTTNPSRRW